MCASYSYSVTTRTPWAGKLFPNISNLRFCHVLVYRPDSQSKHPQHHPTDYHHRLNHKHYHHQNQQQQQTITSGPSNTTTANPICSIDSRLHSTPTPKHHRYQQHIFGLSLHSSFASLRCCCTPVPLFAITISSTLYTSR